METRRQLQGFEHLRGEDEQTIGLRAATEEEDDPENVGFEKVQAIKSLVGLLHQPFLYIFLFLLIGDGVEGGLQFVSRITVPKKE